MDAMTETKKAPPLSIRLLGPFEMRVGGIPLPRLRSRQSQWLLALLILRHDRNIERTWLADTLWPDSNEEQARYNLRRNLTDLRQALGSAAYRLSSASPRTLRFDLAGAFCDLVEFDLMVTRNDQNALEAAISLYQGPLLEDCTEEWAQPERITREEAYLSALEKLAALVGKDDPAAAARYLRRIIAIDPARETAQQRLMEALAALGDYAAITQVYREFRLYLHQELHIEPDSETIALYRRLRTEEHGVQEENRPRRPLSAPFGLNRAAPRQLPQPLTLLIGREYEVREITDRLQTARLMTLTGTGGIGKTRLAVAVAEEITGRFPDGVWFADLAPLTDPALVPQTVASLLTLREDSERPLTVTLQNALQNQSLLLILDNCEHLIEACAQLAQALLSHCPHLHILATSRQILGVTGEVAWRVPSLTLPPTLPPTALSFGQASREQRLLQLMSYEAVQLFAERGVSVNTEFRITAENIETIVQICRMLDGIPLAIELAAAWVKILSVEEIASRLNHRLQLLIGGSRTALPRQQTLRTLLDWSYDLLSPKEKELLGRLSVFAGGWTLEAAEAICPTGREPKSEILNLLSQLADKSLIAYTAQGGAARYRLPEILREYAAEKLPSEEHETLQQQHCLWYLGRAQRTQWGLEGTEQEKALDEFRQEYDNLRAALEWCQKEDSRTEIWVRLVATLWPFWRYCGFLREGRQWLSATLERSRYAVTSPAARAKALEGAATLACSQGDYASAQLLHEESLALFESARDKLGIAYTLNNLGVVAYCQGKTAQAEALYQQSLRLFREQNHRRGVAYALTSQGNLAFRQEDYADAKRSMEEARLLFIEFGDEWDVAYVLLTLGLVAWHQGEYSRARSLQQESLLTFCRLGDQIGITCSLEGFATVEGQPARVARLLGAAEAAREAIGLPMPPIERPAYERCVESARAVLGEAAFTAARAEGRVMTQEQVIAFALGE